MQLILLNIQLYIHLLLMIMISFAFIFVFLKWTQHNKYRYLSTLRHKQQTPITNIFILYIVILYIVIYFVEETIRGFVNKSLTHFVHVIQITRYVSNINTWFCSGNCQPRTFLFIQRVAKLMILCRIMNRQPMDGRVFKETFFTLYGYTHRIVNYTMNKELRSYCSFN